MWGENWGEMIWGGGSAAAVQIPFGPWTLLFFGFVLGVCAVSANRSRVARVVPFVMVLLVPVAAVVAVVAVNLPHTFVNGTIADGDQVNENFAALRSELDSIKGTPPILDSVIARPTNPGDGAYFANCDLTWSDPDDGLFVVELCPHINGLPLSWCNVTRPTSARSFSVGGNANVPNVGDLKCIGRIWDGYSWSEYKESTVVSYSFP